MLFDFNSALRSAIQTNQVFSGAGADHVKRIMANGTKQKFKEKEVFIRAGQRNESLYLIVEGQVEVRLDQATDEPGLSRLATIKLTSFRGSGCCGIAIAAAFSSRKACQRCSTRCWVISITHRS